MTRRILSIAILAILTMFLFSHSAFEQKQTDEITVVGYVMDKYCLSTHSLKEDAMDHPNACALMDACKRSGYGIIIDQAGETVYTLDEQGVKLAIAALEAHKEKLGLRVTIVGTLDGETLHVAKLEYTPKRR